MAAVPFEEESPESAEAAEAKIGRKNMTPSQLAKVKLGEELKKYEHLGINKELRNRFQDEMLKLQDLTYMNMMTLAATLSFLYFIGNRIPTVEDFNGYNMQKILNEFSIPPHLTPEEKTVLQAKHKADILRYTTHINIHRVSYSATTVI